MAIGRLSRGVCVGCRAEAVGARDSPTRQAEVIGNCQALFADSVVAGSDRSYIYVNLIDILFVFLKRFKSSGSSRHGLGTLSVYPHHDRRLFMDAIHQA